MSRRNSTTNLNSTSARNHVDDRETLSGDRSQSVHGSKKWIDKLLSAMSMAVRPITSLSAPPKRRAKKTHSTTTPVLASQGLEGLESRMLLTVTVNQLTLEDGDTVTISKANFDTSGNIGLEVRNVTHGYFWNIAQPGLPGPITNFTQAQVDNGMLRFTHDGSGVAPNFELWENDGVMLTGPNTPTITFGTPPAAPEITSNGGGATASISIAENQSTATTVTATDANTSDTLTYSISGGDDAAKFSIDGTTGVLSFVATPNFEAPDDTGANHVYNVNVKVTDSTERTDEQSLEITITDANESVTATSSPVSMFVLDKQDTTDGVVVGTLTVGDPDDADSNASLTGSEAHVYTFSGADKNYFSIDGDSILLYADVVDASAKSSYSATLTITDGPNTKEIPLHVTVRTLQQQIDAAEDGDTLTLIPGTYPGFAVTEKNLYIIANGVTIQGGISALVVDTANVNITGATFLDGAGDPEVEQPVIGVVKGSTLTLVECTVFSDSIYTLSLIGVDGTSTLDLSSGDNTLDTTTTTNAFTLLLEGAEIAWDSGNTLKADTYEDQSVIVDARIDGSEVVNLFTTPETKGYVIINDDGTLTYTPDDNFSGTATFDFELASGAVGTIVIGIQSVNDQPTFVVGSDVSVDADAEGVQTVEGQIDLSLVNFGPGDEDSTQSGTFTTTATNLDLFVTAPSIDADGNLTFELDTEALLSLAQGETVTSEVSVTLQDDGGTDNGGIDTSDTLTFTITVVGKNDAPTTSDATTSGNEDAMITGTLTANDVDSDAVITFTQVGSVAGLTINSDGTYSFDASDDAYQSLKQGETLEVVAQYKATDEFGASSTSSLTITLTGTNDAPVATDELNTGVEGDLITGNIAEQDIDHDAVLSFWLVDDVPGLIINDNGSYSFDASGQEYASLRQGETRDITAEYSVTDEHESSSSGSLTIRLTGTNDAPVVQIAELPAFTISEDPGRPVFVRGIQVLDVDAYDAAVTVTLSVRNGTLSVDPDAAAAGNLTYSGSGTRSLTLSGVLTDLNRFMGSIRTRSVTSVGVQYLPDGNYNTIDGVANTQGAELITVSATDDNNAVSDEVTKTITVTEVNDAPTAIATTKTVNEDGSVTFNIASVAAPGPTLESWNQSLSLIGGGKIVAAHGFVTMNLAAGTVTYRPKANYHGPDTFSFQVRDNGTTNGILDKQKTEILITMTVLPVFNAPTILGPAANTVAMKPTLSWTAEPDAVSYEITVGEQVTGLTSARIVVVANGSVNTPLVNHRVTGTSYTPPSNLGIGRFIYWVRAVDANGVKSPWSTSHTFNITTPVVVNAPASLRQFVSRPTMTWQPLAGAVKYEVLIDDISTKPGRPQFIRTETSETTWTHDSDLALGRYRIWVRGIDEKGIARDWSIPKEFVVATPPIANPIASTFDRTPTLTWSPVTGALNYEVVVKSGTNGSEVFRQTVTGTSATPTADLAIGSYNWQVRAIGAGNYSSNFTSNSPIFIGGRPISNPVIVNSGVPTFSWVSVQGAATYEVRVDRLDVPEINVIHVTGLTETNLTHSAALNVGTYRFWVRAISSTGETSLWSVFADFSVSAGSDSDRG